MSWTLIDSSEALDSLLSDNRHHAMVAIIGQQRVQRVTALDQRPAHSRTTVLPLSAWASVLASVYSNSPPKGTP